MPHGHAHPPASLIHPAPWVIEPEQTDDGRRYWHVYSSAGGGHLCVGNFGHETDARLIAFVRNVLLADGDVEAQMVLLATSTTPTTVIVSKPGPGPEIRN